MIKWRKLKNKDIQKEPLHRWLSWLDPHSQKELVAEVIEMDQDIQKAEERQEYVLSDEAAEQLYEMRLKAQLDWNSAYNHAIETGMEKGREAALLNTARSALSEGLPIEIIQKITGLDTETIKRLSWTPEREPDSCNYSVVGSGKPLPTPYLSQLTAALDLSGL